MSVTAGVHDAGWSDPRPTAAAVGGDHRQRGAAAGRLLLALAVAVTLAGAGAYVWRFAPEEPSADVSGGQRPAPSATESTGTSPSPTTATPTPTETVRYRVEVRTADDTGADFAATVHEILTDPRGWVRAGFDFVRDPEARFRVVLAEGDEVDRLCHPYDTGGRYSCQNGPIVALNADRWRHATEPWAGDLVGYRTMLVNHEVGHLLHLHHPRPQCPAPGLPAPVMAQQSSGTDPCHPHPWPLQWEIELAAERREPLAPGADHDPEDHRPTPPPARK